MPKHHDPIQNAVVNEEALSLADQARRGIRSIQRRINNPDMPEDCRRLARQELRRWWRILLKEQL